jgi:hypothetical protein
MESYQNALRLLVLEDTRRNMNRAVFVNSPNPLRLLEGERLPWIDY